jgi:hypothetical protein
MSELFGTEMKDGGNGQVSEGPGGGLGGERKGVKETEEEEHPQGTGQG